MWLEGGGMGQCTLLTYHHDDNAKEREEWKVSRRRELDSVIFVSMIKRNGLEFIIQVEANGIRGEYIDGF